MELFATVKDKDLPVDGPENIREASRVVLVDDQGLVPMLYVSKQEYHKFPGGGIDDGEDKMEALKRECIEETGSSIAVDGELGKLEEYRGEWDWFQTSYCYFGKVVTKGQPEFTEYEKERGFQLVWIHKDDVLDTLVNDKPNSYEGERIQQRDTTIMKKFLEIVTDEV